MNILIRILWFLFIGWWLALLWVLGALLVCITLIGLPLGLWMFGKTWAIASLSSHPTKVVHEFTQQVTIINQGSSTKKKSKK